MSNSLFCRIVGNSLLLISLKCLVHVGKPGFKPYTSSWQLLKTFLLLPQCFQLYLVIIPSGIESFYIYLWLDFFKVACCRFVICGKRSRTHYMSAVIVHVNCWPEDKFFFKSRHQENLFIIIWAISRFLIMFSTL